MSLDCNKKIKEDAFFHVMANYIKACNEFKKFEEDYEKGLYSDLDVSRTDILWHHYHDRVNMFFYLKILVEKNTN